MIVRIACVVMTVMAVALPGGAVDRDFYVGFGAGLSDIDNQEFYPDLGELRLSSEKTFGFKVFGGYRLLDFLALEAGWVDLGGKESRETNVNTHEHQSVEAQVDGWNATALGLIPLGKIDLFAKVGVIGWSSDVRAAVGDVTERLDDSGTDAVYGLGMGFRGARLMVRGEAEWYEIGDLSTVFMVSFSVAYLF